LNNFRSELQWIADSFCNPRGMASVSPPSYLNDLVLREALERLPFLPPPVGLSKPCVISSTAVTINPIFASPEFWKKAGWLPPFSNRNTFSRFVWGGRPIDPLVRFSIRTLALLMFLAFPESSTRNFPVLPFFLPRLQAPAEKIITPLRRGCAPFPREI